jgi:hypothetical protein
VERFIGGFGSFPNRRYGAENLQSSERCRQPIFDAQFREDFLQMRSHSIVPNPKNHADDRTALTGSNPVKDFGFALGETQSTKGSRITTLVF